jgi:hypothetical protein
MLARWKSSSGEDPTGEERPHDMKAMIAKSGTAMNRTRRRRGDTPVSALVMLRFYGHARRCRRAAPP